MCITLQIKILHVLNLNKIVREIAEILERSASNQRYRT